MKTGKDHDLPAKFENHVESWAMDQLPLEISCHDVSRWMKKYTPQLLLTHQGLHTDTPAALTYALLEAERTLLINSRPNAIA